MSAPQLLPVGSLVIDECAVTVEWTDSAGCRRYDSYRVADADGIGDALDRAAAAHLTLTGRRADRAFADLSTVVDPITIQPYADGKP